MTTFIKRSVVVCLLVAGSVILFTSCMPDAAEPNSQLQIGVRLQNIDSTLVAENDTLIINRVRMIHGDSFFTISQDSTVRITFARQLSFSSGKTTVIIYPDTRYPRRSSATFPEGVYQGLTFKIVRVKSVPDDMPGFNPQPIFTDEGNYSIVVNGVYNGKEFTLKAADTFKYKFEFTPPVEVTSKAKLYQFLISADVKSWFKKENGGFLNPANDKNIKAIYENIAASFRLKRLGDESGKSKLVMP